MIKTHKRFHYRPHKIAKIQRKVKNMFGGLLNNQTFWFMRNMLLQFKMSRGGKFLSHSGEIMTFCGKK